MPTPRIPFERVVDLVEGRVPEDERAALLAQVAADPHTSQTAAELARIVELMRTDDTPDAPEHVVARAVRLFRQRAAPAAPGLRQRIQAVLTFDSAQRPLAMGMRSGQAAGRQLLFNAAARDLDLRIAPADSLWAVSGQVLGDCDGGQIELHGPMFQVQAALNQLCEFTLPPVPAGNYTLNLRMPDLEIEIAGLDIGA